MSIPTAVAVFMYGMLLALFVVAIVMAVLEAVSRRVL